MTENIQQMRERHEREIKALQDACRHEKISDWMPFEWAPGHIAGEVRVCETCGKTVEERGTGPAFIIDREEGS